MWGELGSIHGEVELRIWPKISGDLFGAHLVHVQGISLQSRVCRFKPCPNLVPGKTLLRGSGEPQSPKKAQDRGRVCGSEKEFCNLHSRTLELPTKNARTIPSQPIGEPQKCGQFQLRALNAGVEPIFQSPQFIFESDGLSFGQKLCFAINLGSEKHPQMSRIELALSRTSLDRHTRMHVL
jgi:hypothetical protein